MRLILIVYLVIGALVAAARNYFERLDNIRGIVSLSYRDRAVAFSRI